MSRLHEAAAAGNASKVKEYLNAGDNINDMSESVTSKGEVYDPSRHISMGEFGRKMTPLHLAAYNGHIEVVRILIAAGADLEQRDAWNQYVGQTALEIALAGNNIGLATMLVQMGATDDAGLLKKAIKNRNVEDELFDAALYKKPGVIFDLHSLGLLEKEAGERALCYAAKFDAKNVAEELIQCGVSPSCYVGGFYRAIDERVTPLGVAAENGSEDVLELLLNHGVDPDQYTSTSPVQQDCTPLRQALLDGSKKPDSSIVKLLLSYGADVKKINPRGLSCMIDYGDAKEVELLIDAGLDPNTVAEGRSLMTHCMEHSDRDSVCKIALVLIKKGADTNHRDDSGRTYLHINSDPQVARALVASGCDINAVDDRGRTPIQCVLQNFSVWEKSGRGSIHETLLELGARVTDLDPTSRIVQKSDRLRSAFEKLKMTPEVEELKVAAEQHAPVLNTAWQYNQKKQASLESSCLSEASSPGSDWEMLEMPETNSDWEMVQSDEIPRCSPTKTMA